MAVVNYGTNLWADTDNGLPVGNFLQSVSVNRCKIITEDFLPHTREFTFSNPATNQVAYACQARFKLISSHPFFAAAIAKSNHANNAADAISAKHDVHAGHAITTFNAEAWTCIVKLRTYLVEDNATIRDNLIATLEELTSIQAIGSSDSENEGTAWLQNNPDDWDLAILDLFLKQGSGLGVLVGCQNRRPYQKVVVLSNYATPDIRRRCAQLGVDAVFDKSNEIEGLIEFCTQQSDAAEASS